MEDLLRDFPVTVTVPVAWGDMDAFQHVNNTVYFRYFETARIAYFDKLDLMTQMAATGIGPILSHTQCRFKLPLTYPDTVTVGARVDDIKVDRFVMIYRAVSRRHEKVAAEGDGTLVAYHYGEGRKASVPDVLRKRIEDIENAAGA